MGMLTKTGGPFRLGRRSRLAVTALAVGAASVLATAVPASALEITKTDGAVQTINVQSKTFRLARHDKIVGNENLSIFSNGNFNFDVHGVNNLMARRQASWLCVVKSASNTAFTFSWEDTIMAAGDNRYDKTISGTAPNLQNDWPNMWAAPTAVCSMGVSGDLRGLFNELKPDLGELKEVVAIVGTFIG
jgi:hypothetical protein